MGTMALNAFALEGKKKGGGSEKSTIREGKGRKAPMREREKNARRHSKKEKTTASVAICRGMHGDQSESAPNTGWLARACGTGLLERGPEGGGKRTQKEEVR